MASHVLTIRLSEEMQRKLEDTCSMVKRKTPTGAEVNNSTIARGALEELFKKIEEEKNEVVKVSVPLIDTKKEELEETLVMLETMLNSIDEQKLIYENSKRTISAIKLLKTRIKGKLIEIIY